MLGWRDGYYWAAKPRRESGASEREFAEILKRDWEEFERRLGKKKWCRAVRSGGCQIQIISGWLSSRRFHFGFLDLYNQDLRGKRGCTPTSAGCRYSVRIWKARICSGLDFIGHISKQLHFAAQS